MGGRRGKTGSSNNAAWEPRSSTSGTSRQEIRMSSPDVDRIAVIAAYTSNPLAGKRVDRPAKAAAAARGRARAIASEAGVRIGAISNAAIGQNQSVISRTFTVSALPYMARRCLSLLASSSVRVQANP